MIEPEVAFFDLKDNMDLAESMLKYVIAFALDHCADDIQFLKERQEQEESTKPQSERSTMDLVTKLHFVVDNEFQRLKYEEAIQILINSTPNKKGKFQYPIEGWSQGACKKYGKGKIVVFGEAAMFTAQLAGPNKRPIGMNSPDAQENHQLLLNIIHWLDGRMD